MFHGPVSEALPFFTRDLGFSCPPRKDVPSFLQEVATASGGLAPHMPCYVVQMRMSVVLCVVQAPHARMYPLCSCTPPPPSPPHKHVKPIELAVTAPLPNPHPAGQRDLAPPELLVRAAKAAGAVAAGGAEEEGCSEALSSATNWVVPPQEVGAGMGLGARMSALLGRLPSNGSSTGTCLEDGGR